MLIGIDSYNKYHSNYIYLPQPVIWVIIGFSLAIFSIGLRYWLQDLHIIMRWWKWLLKNNVDQPEGFAYLGEGQGYAGEIIILVITDPKTQIQDISVIKHAETPSYFQRLVDNRFFEQLSGKDPENIGEQDDIDIVSGATITCDAILQAIENAYRRGEGKSD